MLWPRALFMSGSEGRAKAEMGCSRRHPCGGTSTMTRGSHWWKCELGSTWVRWHIWETSWSQPAACTIKRAWRGWDQCREGQREESPWTAVSGTTGIWFTCCLRGSISLWKAEGQMEAGVPRLQRICSVVCWGRWEDREYYAGDQPAGVLSWLLNMVRDNWYCLGIN